MTRLEPGQPIPYGGDRVTLVPAELAEAFRTGDRLVVVQESGDLLHLPAAQVALAEAAVSEAAEAFDELAAVDDERIRHFYDLAAQRLADDAVFAPVAAANAADVRRAEQRGRATGRLALSPSMRAAMVDGLRMWGDLGAPSPMVEQVGHEGWSVEIRRAPLGVVGFVFEGRPNVLTDACGVVRTRNTAVLRIGSDALGTARALITAVIEPALREAGLPDGAVRLIDSTAHAAGWALFSDRRLGLAIARGSGDAVAQLGSVARQHGVPVSLHGTGGAWMIAAEDAPADRFRASVRWSLDRKVCNTLNVCCIVATRAGELLPLLEQAAGEAAAAYGTVPIVHRLSSDDPALATEWEWDRQPELSVVVVDSVAEALAAFHRHSPRFVASLITADEEAFARFAATVEAPFVGDGMTRWVDGQFALDRPELGLSNWQSGRLLGRAGVLSGDSVFTHKLVARVADSELHR